MSDCDDYIPLGLESAVNDRERMALIGALLNLGVSIQDLASPGYQRPELCQHEAAGFLVNGRLVVRARNGMVRARRYQVHHNEECSFRSMGQRPEHAETLSDVIEMCGVTPEAPPLHWTRPAWDGDAA